MRKNLRGVGGIVGLAFVVALVAYDEIVHAPKAKTAAEDLKREFDAIEQLPGSIRTNDYIYQKPRHVLVGSTYITARSYSELRKHYDQELTRRGWRFDGERERTEWGRSFGGRSAQYCKWNYHAALEHAGQRPTHGWVFALNMSWSPDSLMDESNRGTCTQGALPNISIQRPRTLPSQRPRAVVTPLMLKPHSDSEG